MHTDKCRKRVVLADEHTVFRERIKSFLRSLDFEVAEARNGLEAIRLCQLLKPDLALLDISISRPDRCDRIISSPVTGVEVVRELKARCPDMPIIVLTTHSEPTYVAESICAGASAYVLKSSILSSLKDAVWATCDGAIILGRGVVRKQV